MSSRSGDSILMKQGISRSCWTFPRNDPVQLSAQALMPKNTQALVRIQAAFMDDIEWPQNSVITIGFVRGNQTTQYKIDYVRKIIDKTFRDLVNLKFVWITAANKWKQRDQLMRSESDINRPGFAPMIRISFIGEDGAWSYLGIENLTIPPDQATMNLGWLDDKADYNIGMCQRQVVIPKDGGVVKHEFGHMLGLMHEHQRSDAIGAGKIQWASEAELNAYFGGPPNYWDAETIKHNVTSTVNVSKQNSSVYDPLSIMQYIFSCVCFKDQTPPPGLRCQEELCSSPSFQSAASNALRMGSEKARCSNCPTFEDSAQQLSELDKMTIKNRYPPPGWTVTPFRPGEEVDGRLGDDEETTNTGDADIGTEIIEVDVSQSSQPLSTLAIVLLVVGFAVIIGIIIWLFISKKTSA